MLPLLLLAGLPFATKALTMAFLAKGYGLQSLYKFVQILATLSWRRAHGERGFAIAWPTREPRPSWPLLAAGIGSGVLFGLGAIAATRTLASAFDMDPATLRAGFDAAFPMDGWFAVAVVIFIAFLNSAVEEMHFRGWLGIELSKRAGNAPGIAISALAFSAMHGFILLGFPTMPFALVAVVFCALAFAGTCWSLMIRRSGGIYAAWISHGLADAILLGWGLFWLEYV